LPTLYEQERKLEREVAVAIHERMPEVEVLTVELVSPTRFCVYIDHPAGVDHELCVRVTDALRGFLAKYSVDVSSPGVERPVRTPAHFRGAVGRRVTLRTAAEIQGRKRFRGTVVAADERAVKVETGADEAVDIPYDAIVRGNLIDEGSLR
jgi:ribosome maturation factor RimP